MRYKDEELVNEYLLEALEDVERNPALRGIMNRVLVIDELYTHTANVAKLGVQLGLELGMDNATVKKICLAGLLHDTGKILVPSNILFKPGRLTDVEFDAIKRHSRDGYNLCRGAGVDGEVLDMILHHHEKAGGGGYPDGLRSVSPQCAVLTVADIFSALVEPRLYQRERSIEAAIAFIGTFKGLDDFILSVLREVVVDLPRMESRD